MVNPNAYLSQVLVQTDADGAQTFYVYAPGLLGQETGDGYLTYHYDLRGSTVALCNEDGEVTDRFQYSPFARLVSHTGSTETPFLYNGRDGVMSDANGLYYMRARYYNPEIRRFVNQDVLLGRVADGQSLNRYAYVQGTPTIGIDPMGLGFWDAVEWVGNTRVAQGIYNASTWFGENVLEPAGEGMIDAVQSAADEAVVKPYEKIDTMWRDGDGHVSEKVAKTMTGVGFAGLSFPINAIKGSWFAFYDELNENMGENKMTPEELETLKKDIGFGIDVSTIPLVFQRSSYNGHSTNRMMVYFRNSGSFKKIKWFERMFGERMLGAWEGRNALKTIAEDIENSESEGGACVSPH